MSVTANQAVTQAVVLTGASLDPNQASERIALFDASGNAIDLTPADVPTGEEVVLTGFIEGSPASVTESDTVNLAIGKLQARVIALDDRITALEEA